MYCGWFASPRRRGPTDAWQPLLFARARMMVGNSAISDLERLDPSRCFDVRRKAKARRHVDRTRSQPVRTENPHSQCKWPQEAQETQNRSWLAIQRDAENRLNVASGMRRPASGMLRAASEKLHMASMRLQVASNGFARLAPTTAKEGFIMAKILTNLLRREFPRGAAHVPDGRGNR
jgi:hypothetical protein